jgi:hypothetical protein
MTSTTPPNLKSGGNKRGRDVQRAVHLAGGLLTAAYVYTPLQEQAAFDLLVKVVVFPVVVAAGMAMWQLPRLRRLLRGRGRAAAGPHPTTRGATRAVVR